jgi:GNAT superfamily N-acetyltransferase
MSELHPATVIRELYSWEDPAFLPAMELYVETFPKDEREPLSFYRELLSENAPHRLGLNTRQHVLVVEQGDDLVGMRHFLYSPVAQAAFFVYIALDPVVRGGGIGRRLLEYSQTQCLLDAQATNSHLRTIFFECERIKDSKDHQQRLEREQRLSFFKHMGGEIISTTYVQPSLGVGRDPLPLNLMAYRLDKTISRRDAVLTFYEHFLGRSEDDELVQQALLGVSDDEPA